MSFIIGNHYNWKNQPERLIYLGAKHFQGNGIWHQFSKVDDEKQEVWCEVRTHELDSFEETRMATKEEVVVLLDSIPVKFDQWFNEYMEHPPKVQKYSVKIDPDIQAWNLAVEAKRKGKHK